MSVCVNAGFMYGNVYEDEERFERQAVFPRMLCERAKDFSLVRVKQVFYFKCWVGDGISLLRSTRETHRSIETLLRLGLGEGNGCYSL